MIITNKYDENVNVNFGILHYDGMFGMKDTSNWNININETRKIRSLAYVFVYYFWDCELRTNVIKNENGKIIDIFRASTFLLKALDFKYTIPLSKNNFDSVFNELNIQDRYLIAQVDYLNGRYEKCLKSLEAFSSYDSTVAYYKKIYKNLVSNDKTGQKCLTAIRRGSLFLSILSAQKINDTIAIRKYNGLLLKEYPDFYGNVVKNEINFLTE